MTFNERVAFVTGGSRGIGKGIAIALANTGSNIVFTYNNNHEAAESTCEEIRRNGGKVLALQMKIEDRSSIKHAIAIAIKKMGQINIVVNSAGISQEKPFEIITDADWSSMMSINLHGPFSLIQEVIPIMTAASWGRIINISSIGGQWGGFNQVHYAAAKAGLINLTQSIAKIYSKNGITSNAIAPGLIATDMSAAELNTDAGREKVIGIPARRIGVVEDVGAAVVFLASDEASYITGQTLNLNGGMYFST
jgi:NAD(P)-dependent dehydrogenase (short-subunit alcohol dehydrogenase family)